MSEDDKKRYQFHLAVIDRYHGQIDAMCNWEQTALETCCDKVTQSLNKLADYETLFASVDQYFVYIDKCNNVKSKVKSLQSQLAGASKVQPIAAAPIVAAPVTVNVPASASSSVVQTPPPTPPKPEVAKQNGNESSVQNSESDIKKPNLDAISDSHYNELIGNDGVVNSEELFSQLSIELKKDAKSSAPLNVSKSQEESSPTKKNKKKAKPNQIAAQSTSTTKEQNDNTNKDNKVNSAQNADSNAGEAPSSSSPDNSPSNQKSHVNANGNAKGPQGKGPQTNGPPNKKPYPQNNFNGNTSWSNGPRSFKQNYNQNGYYPNPRFPPNYNLNYSQNHQHHYFGNNQQRQFQNQWSNNSESQGNFPRSNGPNSFPSGNFKSTPNLNQNADQQSQAGDRNPQVNATNASPSASNNDNQASNNPGNASQVGPSHNYNEHFDNSPHFHNGGGRFSRGGGNSYRGFQHQNRGGYHANGNSFRGKQKFKVNPNYQNNRNGGNFDQGPSANSGGSNQ